VREQLARPAGHPEASRDRRPACCWPRPPTPLVSLAFRVPPAGSVARDPRQPRGPDGEHRLRSRCLPTTAAWRRTAVGRGGISRGPLSPVCQSPGTPVPSAIGIAVCTRHGRWVDDPLHEDDTLLTRGISTPWCRGCATELCAVCPQVIQGSVPPTLPARRRPPDPAYPPVYSLKSSSRPFPGPVSRELACARRIRNRAGGAGRLRVWYHLAPRTGRRGGAYGRGVLPRFRRAMDGIAMAGHAAPNAPAAPARGPRATAGRPRLGRWLARFFSHRSAQAYARRFPESRHPESRHLRWPHPLAGLPSGWVWQLVKLLA